MQYFFSVRYKYMKNLSAYITRRWQSVLQSMRIKEDVDQLPGINMLLFLISQTWVTCSNFLKELNEEIYDPLGFIFNPGITER